MSPVEPMTFGEPPHKQTTGQVGSPRAMNSFRLAPGQYQAQAAKALFFMSIRIHVRPGRCNLQATNRPSQSKIHRYRQPKHSRTSRLSQAGKDHSGTNDTARAK